MHMRPFATSGHLRLTSIMYKVCNRCRKANRTCRGYKDETDLIFRHHRHGLDHFRDHSDSQDEQGPPSDDPKTHIPSVAHYTTADWRNATFEREVREQFLQDYSVISSDRSLSRGYLEGLRQLLVYCGPSSELSQAVTIVSFASYANKHSRPEISAEAKYLYFQLLQSFQRTISNVATSNIVEPLLTAVLLGLYEVRRSAKTENRSSTKLARSSRRLRRIRVRTALIPRASRPFSPRSTLPSISSPVQSCSRCRIPSASTQLDWR